MANGEVAPFDVFLEARRALMASKIKSYFEGL
jgi:hypothetical protein